ncbi:MAG: hypothetical protein Q4D06_03245 [Coriobacteriia bacterium]|nr:hypothetical protein [Coriobacteriia bacterium]
MNKIQSAAVDMALNVISTLLPSMVLQLFVLPVISRSMSGDEYGIVIASIALLGLIPLTVGNVLNNVRLLNDESHKRSGLEGGYPLVVACLCALSAVAVCIGSWAVGVVGSIELFVVTLASVIMLIREYLIVEYRLSLSYRKMLCANVVLAIGFVAGVGFFGALGSWGLVYLVGYGASLAYVVSTTTIWRESRAVSPDIRLTIRDAATLGISGLLNKSTAYADKLILVPLLGSSAVAVYYISCLFGKVLSLVIAPISSVMLSYLVKEDRVSRRAFQFALIIGCTLCVFGYIVTVVIAEPILMLMYPQFAEDSMIYLPVVTAASYVMVLSGIANPFVMRFGDLSWQIGLNGVFCCIFFVSCLAGYLYSGLIGFCMGTLVANITRLVLTIVLYARLTAR